MLATDEWDEGTNKYDGQDFTYQNPPPSGTVWCRAAQRRGLAHFFIPLFFSVTTIDLGVLAGLTDELAASNRIFRTLSSVSTFVGLTIQLFGQ
jgi:hypothetical protein